MRKAFTLIELLVVIAIVSILAMAMTRMTSVARENGDSARCQGNLSGLHQAVMNYANDNDGAMPRAGTYDRIEIDGRHYQKLGWLKWTIADKNDPPDPVYYEQGGGVEDASQPGKLCHPVWGPSGTVAIDTHALDSIQLSDFYEYTSRDMSLYLCPKFRRTNRTAVRSYTMNYWFGSRRNPIRDHRNLLHLATRDGKQASRLLLFTELPVTAGKSAAGKLYHATAQHNRGKPYGQEPKGNDPNFRADGCFDFDDQAASPPEVYGGLHRKAGRLYAHAVFVDGHIESLEFKADNDANEKLSKEVGTGVY